MDLSQVDIQTKERIMQTIGYTIPTINFYQWLCTMTGRQYTIYNGSNITNLQILESQTETPIIVGIITKVFEDGNSIYLELDSNERRLEVFNYQKYSGISTKGFGTYYILYPDCSYFKLVIQ
ncbi:hypothetical protein COF68_06180 [Bacillus toyonensis]|uniref:hypothetical protein n=1 Tax=Bacillus toyonensis TaxID=155322 RepID=UPI000BFDCABA|nr:hypothetical protein [Bacillus toyonensis]PHE64421.1 hypothetical protein COF68_06180 [Bacillus toyonensis]